MATKKKSSSAKKIGIGIGVVTAIAAGVYLLSGEKGKKNRKKVASWVDRAKREVLAEMVKAEKISKSHYNKIVDKVMSQYKVIDKAEALRMIKDMKSHWSNIADEVQEIKKVAEQTPEKIVKKPTKKSSKTSKK